MLDGHVRLQKARYYSSVTVLYLVTLLFAAYLFRPGIFVHAQPLNLQNTPTQPAQTEKPAIAGKPVRIVIEKIHMDLAVGEGNYNPADGSWTLAKDKAFFAMPSMLANDQAGNTIIYGHNIKSVFKPLAGLTEGDKVIIYTDNGHMFAYSYQSRADLRPNDISFFKADTDPTLILQTCEGTFSEWRRMYVLSLQQVLQ